VMAIVHMDLGPGELKKSVIGSEKGQFLRK
jgi:hypothetical protein